MAGSYSLGEHFEQFVKEQVASGRYNNESEVVRDALRLAELRELKLQALREHVSRALQRGGSYTDEEMAALLAADVEG
jgi:antitoxin ParD1/3/4